MRECETEGMKTIIPPGSVNESAEIVASFPIQHRLARRSFLRSLGLGAALLAPGAAFFSSSHQLLADMGKGKGGVEDKNLSKGDVAILQFLAAAELLETDLW